MDVRRRKLRILALQYQLVVIGSMWCNVLYYAIIRGNNHIRFAINPDAAERADLKISSKLLALAKIVHEGPTNGKS